MHGCIQFYEHTVVYKTIRLRHAQWRMVTAVYQLNSTKGMDQK